MQGRPVPIPWYFVRPVRAFQLPLVLFVHQGSSMVTCCTVFPVDVSLDLWYTGGLCVLGSPTSVYSMEARMCFSDIK